MSIRVPELMRFPNEARYYESIQKFRTRLRLCVYMKLSLRPLDIFVTTDGQINNSPSDLPINVPIEMFNRNP